MLSFFRCSLLIAGLTTIVTIPVQNQVQAGGRHCCCQTCRQPCGHCNCQSQAAVWQQRDVVATEYRNETVVETVPATVVENVTVDEGSYQTVWVPRLTTKAVARTIYQTRTACRTVPYQVTRRVSECTTVPYQTVHSMPTNATTIGSAIGPRYGSTVLQPVYGNGTLAAGTYPTLASSAASTNAGVPDARYADSPVTPITPRSASSGSRIERRVSDNRTADRGSSLFVPAPSAAQVWRSTQGSVVR